MDKVLFTTINSIPHYPLIDNFIYLLDLIVQYGIIFITIILFNIISNSNKRKTYAKLSLISLILTTIIVNIIIKNLVGRTRPGFVISDVYYIHRVPSGYSFPSGHTATIFAVATMNFLLLKSRTQSIIIYVLSILTAFSRIYAGHHYPSDVVFGALFGILISVIIFNIYNKKSEIKS